MSYSSTMRFLRGDGFAGRVGGSDAPVGICDAMCTMRAAYLTYRNAHWQTRGYGNHLLFERLYDDLKEQIDHLAEQAVGSWGPDAVREDAEIIAARVAEFAAQPDPITKSLLAARTVREKLRATYKSMQVEGIEPGWEDLLTDLARGTDKHIYLLQQA